MWKYEHSVETAAGPDAVFAVLEDVTRWPEWNHAPLLVSISCPSSKTVRRAIKGIAFASPALPFKTQLDHPLSTDVNR